MEQNSAAAVDLEEFQLMRHPIWRVPKVSDRNVWQCPSLWNWLIDAEWFTFTLNVCYDIVVCVSFIMMASLDVAGCEDGESTEHDSTAAEYSGRVAEHQVVLSKDQSSVKDAKSDHMPVIEGGSSASMEQNSADDDDLRGVPADETSNVESTKSKWPECPAMAITFETASLIQSALHSSPKCVIISLYVFPISWWCLWMLQNVMMVYQQNTIPLKRNVREGWLRTRLSSPRINHLWNMPKVTTRLW